MPRAEHFDLDFFLHRSLYIAKVTRFEFIVLVVLLYIMQNGFYVLNIEHRTLAQGGTSFIKSLLNHIKNLENSVHQFVFFKYC